MNDKVFAVAPASGLSLWVFGVLVIFLIAMLVLFARFSYWSKNTTVTLSEQGIVIDGGPYGRTLLFSSIDADGISVVNVNDDEGHKLGRRSDGVAIPGYRSGWFVMKSGEKALVFLTELAGVVRLPTTEGYVVLLSVEEADQFVEAVHAAVGG